MKKTFVFLVIAFLAALSCCREGNYLGLTLIPPGTVTDKVDLDIRAGIVNNSDAGREFDVELYLKYGDVDSLLQKRSLDLKAHESVCVSHALATEHLSGKECEVVLKVKSNGSSVNHISKRFKVLESEIRSTRLIDGAWAGIYHWSEEEGRHWNDDIRQLSDGQWKEMVASMHEIGMDIIVIQEVFRNDANEGEAGFIVENYQGKAFYPSELYHGRMPIRASDPIEAILSQADDFDMQVFVGVGMFAWFDFTGESLEWHKNVAAELWKLYGHHKSFYGFYISEESAGNLCKWEKTAEMQRVRKNEIVDFFREFKKFTAGFAPDKPVMLATNSMGVPDGADTYPALLENLDILCPFGFARMPEGDLTGKQAADMLQGFCDEAGAHLWFDLEAFLFNPDMSLYPRPIDEIVHDLTLFDNFEKVLCYQFPGVFSNPALSFRVGEERTLQLYDDYKSYRESVAPCRKNAD